jgi:uncharacterized protein (DUF1697 family)
VPKQPPCPAAATLLPVQYAVFLRAINVGRVNRIRMQDLRELLTRLGYADVSTYLQTGNVLLNTGAPAGEVAAGIEAALAGHGLTNVSAMVRTRAELAEIVAACPFDRYDDPTCRQWLTFFREPLPGPLQLELAGAPAVVCVRDRELMTVTGLAQPAREDPSAAISRKARIPATTRYWRVARDLLALMD